LRLVKLGPVLSCLIRAQYYFGELFLLLRTVWFVADAARSFQFFWAGLPRDLLLAGLGLLGLE